MTLAIMTKGITSNCLANSLAKKFMVIMSYEIYKGCLYNGMTMNVWFCRRNMF